MRGIFFQIFFMSAGLSVFGLSAACVCSAEVIHLKNGRIIEGEVTDQTDEYIKIQSGGGIFKINFSQMSAKSQDLFRQDIKVSRHEKERKAIEGSPSGDSAAQTTESVGVVGWTGWQLTSSYYRNQAERNMMEMNRLAFQGAMRVAQSGATLKQRYEAEMRWLQEARVQVGDLIKDFQSVNPPPEFARYHAKILEFQSAARKSMDAHLLKDMQAYTRWHRKGLLAFIQALEELQILFKKHGAPAEEIKKIDKQIRAERELLRQGVTMTYVDTGKPVNFSIPAREGTK